MNKNDKYEQLLKDLPDEIVSKFIIPLSSHDIISHETIVRFLFVLYDKGYKIVKQ